MQAPLAFYAAVFVIALIAAGAIWFVLVRPVPEQTAAGAIVNRWFEEEETVETTTPRIHRGLEYLPQKRMYRLPDRYTYEIALDDLNRTVRYWARAVEGHNMNVGQRVRVVYVERGIPLVWSRIYVTNVEPLR